MSDEEIAAARDNIEYDKYDKIYSEVIKKPAITIPEVPFDKIFTPAKNRSIDNSDREMPVVAEERNNEDEIEEYTFSNESEEGLSFDYSDATPNDLLNASKSLQTTTDFKKLKEEVEKLKQRQLMTKNKVISAEQAQLAAAKKAEEAKRKTAESKKAYDEMVNNLVKYSEALREDCQFNENKAKLADTDRECSERFIKSQEEEANGYMELVNEMNDLITPRATNVRRR
jgi:hypothetical protein